MCCKISLVKKVCEKCAERAIIGAVFFLEIVAINQPKTLEFTTVKKISMRIELQKIVRKNRAWNIVFYDEISNRD